MRSSSIVVSLLVSAAATPPALAAPVPVVLVQGLDTAVSGAAQQAAQKTFSQHDSSSPSGIDNGATEIDNRPYTPSSKASPEVVLATPRPLITAYLMGLAPPKSKAKETPAEQQGKAVKPGRSSSQVGSSSAAGKLQMGGAPEDESLDEAEATIVAAYSKSIGSTIENANVVAVPCYYSQLRHAHDEMMVISMVAVFLLVIAVIEFWDTCRLKKLDLEAAPAGAIRLEDKQDFRSSEKQPVSVQAAPLHFDLASEVSDDKSKTN